MLLLLPRLLLLPHLLGLDVALVALLWQEITARFFHVPLGIVPRGVLFFTVWGIYLLDRVWDVKRLPESSLPSMRHLWARKRILFLSFLGILNLLLSGILSIRYLESRFLSVGLCIGFLCIIYYALHGIFGSQKPILWRALLLGSIFAIGVMGIPLVEFKGRWIQSVAFLATLSLLLSANAFSCMQAEDALRRIGSVGLKANPLIFPAIILSGFYAVVTGNNAPILSSVALGMLLLGSSTISRDSFSALCDATLLLPGVILFWKG